MENKKVLVIYHRADFDGLFCREIARKFFGENAEYVGWDYGDPKIAFDPTRITYVMDLSPECFESVPEPVHHLVNLVWIDHHKTAIDRWSGAITGFRIDGVAACRLAWQYFFGNPNDHASLEDFRERRVREPWAVRLAGEYDIWDKRDPMAELFQHGLRSRNMDKWWPFLIELPQKMDVREIEALTDVGHPPELLPDGLVDATKPLVNELLEAGRVIQYAKEQENADIIKAYGFDLEWEGLKFLACNHARFNSHLFTAGLRPEHDACFGFKWDGQNQTWSVSLYHVPGKEQHDLSVIAKKNGGGGHRGACEFRVDYLPFGLAHIKGK